VSLFLIAALPFLGAILPALLIRAGRNATAWTTASVTGLAFIGLLTHAPAVLRGEVITARLDWMPGLGLNANFFLDGLGLLFAGLILGIGLLIILYARFYLSREDPMGQFYTYLLLFQGAMVGIVLSDNILLLLIFWELTSLSSFLLIGYWKHLPDGRQGARMALAVTGMGGLAMIGGMLILGNIVGSYDLTVILQNNRELIQVLAALRAGASADPAGLFHQVGAVPVPFLAAARDGGADAGLGLPAFGDDGEGGPVPDGAAVAGAGGHRDLVLHRHHHRAGDHGDGRDHRALQGRPEGAAGLLDGQPSGPDHDASGLRHQVRGGGGGVSHHQPRHLQGGPVHDRGDRRPRGHTRDIKRLGGLRTLMPITFTIATIAALSMAGFRR
jgi:multicomponent K+:H+ antiporter subunit A